MNIKRPIKHSYRPSRRLLAEAVVLVFAIAGTAMIFQGGAAPNPNLIGDLNSDNIVNITDLSLLLANWNKSYAPGPGPTPVPPMPPGSPAQTLGVGGVERTTTFCAGDLFDAAMTA